MSIDYSKAQIYKLCCNDFNITEIYIGSTIAFRRRKAGHKYTCNTETNRHFNQKLYQYIRANGGFQNWQMILIESVTSCSNKQELLARERWYIEQMKPTLNITNPILSHQEQKDNKKISDKAYKDNHKEEIKAYNKAYKTKT